MSELIKPTPQQVLDLELSDNDSGEETVRGYLVALLAGVWAEDEGFNGKRPFGNSGWKGDFDAAFIAAGWVAGSLDHDGYVEESDTERVDALVRSAIAELAKPTAAPSLDETRVAALNCAVVLRKDSFRPADDLDFGGAVVRDAAVFAAFLATGDTPAPVAGSQETTGATDGAA